MRPHDRLCQRRWQRALVLLVLAAGAGRVPAQDQPWGVYQEDPLWLAYVPQLEYLKTDVEMQQSSYRLVGGATKDWDQLTVMPAVGIRWNNYLYNPYLLNYSLLFEPGYYWQQTGASGSQSRIEELMLNGSATVNMLAAKPFATSVSFGRSHEEVQSDFFTSQTVDSQTWSVLSGYRAGAVPVTLTLDQSQEDRSGDNQDFITDQLKIGLHAVNDRKNAGMTVLDYQFNQYQNQSSAGSSSYSSESSSHYALLTDMEHFRESSLSSTLNFNERESEGTSSSDLNAACNYNLELTPHFRSFCTYSVSDSFGGGYDSVQNNIVAGINHQLYDSLTSYLDLHGLFSDSNSAGAILNSSSYGTAASVSYNKRLGDWAHFIRQQFGLV